MNKGNLKQHPELYRYICKLANCKIPNFSPNEWNTFTKLLDESLGKLAHYPALSIACAQLRDQRAKLNLTLREVADESLISAATISRIERGLPCEYSNIQVLFDYYLIKSQAQ